MDLNNFKNNYRKAIRGFECVPHTVEGVHLASLDGVLGEKLDFLEGEKFIWFVNKLNLRHGIDYFKISEGKKDIIVTFNSLIKICETINTPAIEIIYDRIIGNVIGEPASLKRKVSIENVIFSLFGDFTIDKGFMLLGLNKESIKISYYIPELRLAIDVNNDPDFIDLDASIRKANIVRETLKCYYISL